MPTHLNRINRLPERARHDRADLYAVLDAGHHVGTLSTVVDGEPLVVPMLFGRVGDQLILHGSTGAGALRRVAAGAPAALCVFHMDGWIYAHTMFNQSAHFRSAVVHGTLSDVPESEAGNVLTQLTESLTPGRSSEVPPHTRKHLAATLAMTMQIQDGSWTVKVRDGDPTAPEPGEEVDPDLWRGVIPIHTAYGEPIPAPGVDPSLPVSPSIARLLGTPPA